MDAQAIKMMLYAIGGGVLLFLLFRYLARPKHCEVCGTETSNHLNTKNSQSVILCKIHLADRWVSEVNASLYTMIIIEPDFENYPYGYVYGDVTDLGLWEYGEESQNNISKILETISGKACAECGVDATVAYFKKDDYPVPEMEKISATPTYLCKSCATKKVKPHLQNAVKDISEGVDLPTKDKGIFAVQEY